MKRGLPTLLSVGIAACVLAPVVAIGLRAGQADPGAWTRLLGSDQLPVLLINTILVALGASVVATGCALAGSWLVVRRSMPGQSLAVALLASPLVVPPYLVAQLWMEISGPGKPLEALLGGRIGGQLLSSALVIGLCTSPLCFLVIRAALARLDQNHEDAAATLGLSPRQRVLRVVLPALRPALAAGVCLVALYACADFGAVSALGTRTFTQAMFFELALNLQDRPSAWDASAILGSVLLLVAMPPYLADRWLRRKARYEHVRGERRPVSPRPLGPLGQVGAWCFVALVVLPTSGLVLARSLVFLTELEDGSSLWLRAGSALSTSFQWAVAAASLATLAALVVCWTASRTGGRLESSLVPLASSGYALPGPLVALGALLLVTSVAPLQALLYGSAALLILVYTVRFLPEALQAVDAGLAQAPRSLEEVSRTLGLSRARAVVRVTLPIMSSSILAAWVFVFTASMRELPATLLLPRPDGSRTLATEIWSFAEDGHWAQMAPSSILLVVFSVPAVAFLLRQEQK